MIVKSKQPNYKGFMNNSNQLLTTIVVDGAQYGERVLEDVKFVVSVDHGFLCVETREDHKHYMEDHNEKMWLTTILNEIETSGDCSADSIDREGEIEDLKLVRKDGSFIKLEHAAIPLGIVKTGVGDLLSHFRP